MVCVFVFVLLNALLIVYCWFSVRPDKDTVST